jgi:phosphoribosylformylglycinamidine synthase|tara:strand:+ start:3483 stop:3788 length:306 start_codon:yes stop_codon:yes gene_type:complete
VHRPDGFDTSREDDMKFTVLVDVRLRSGIADPAGATIERALPALGYEGVSGVSVGKTIRFTIDAADEQQAISHSEDLRDSFLTNPVIEDAEVTVSPGAGDL